MCCIVLVRCVLVLRCGLAVVVWYPYAGWGTSASACHTDTTPTSHTETPAHIETRTHGQYGDKIEKSQAPDEWYINVRNMLSIEEVK